jgi:putative ABC transport system permease protein
VGTQKKLRDEISSGIHRLYSLAYAQQSVVGLVALLGVISALFISVLQRTREFGLLRAVGASRAQILRSVLAEAALMGLIGAVIGLALGFALEWYVIRILLLDEAGFLFPLRIPWLASAVVAGLSVTLATLVGLWPAWHATRLRIPEAIAYE